MSIQPHPPIRAPHGAIAWAAPTGFLYENHEVAEHLDRGDVVLVVSESDGMLRGIGPLDRAPLAAVIRVESDIAELVRAVDDLAAQLEGADTGNALELVALKRRVRTLEEAGR